MQQSPRLLLLSLLLGGALCVFVTDAENPRQVDLFPVSINVEAVNVASSLAVASPLQSVQVRVVTTEDHWDRLTSGNFRAFVDLNGSSARLQQLPVQVNVRGISAVRVVETIPGSIVMDLGPFTRKTVPVASRLVGTVPLGYQVGDARHARDTVG
ncbi:MAG: hypothetical protein EXR65_02880 [Dehalococcoidia bacterium]|nr:hypothetical protein [Dehalococcoidia bacterium]